MAPLFDSRLGLLHRGLEVVLDKGLALCKRANNRCSRLAFMPFEGGLAFEVQDCGDGEG